MTNEEYIKENISTIDIVNLMQFSFGNSAPIIKKAMKAFDSWVESTGNGGNFVLENGSLPSIWSWEIWHYPDRTRKKIGRTKSVAVQVWLFTQYNEEDWSDDE